MGGRSSFDTTLLRPGLLITGSFALKFSPSDFGILLTHSNLRWTNALWGGFSGRNENRGRFVVSEITHWWLGYVESDARTRAHSQSFRETARRSPIDFARSAFEVRCVLASLFWRTANLRELLPTRPGHRDNKLAVFLGDEVFACAG